MRTWNAGTVMTEELRIWSVDDGGKAEPLSPLKQMPTELEFEELLVTNPEMLEPGLRLIGRQTPTQTGWLDLLAVDTDGRLVVFELKRRARSHPTPRPGPRSSVSRSGPAPSPPPRIAGRARRLGGPRPWPPRAHPPSRGHRLQPQPDRPLGQHPRLGSRGRRPLVASRHRRALAAPVPVGHPDPDAHFWRICAAAEPAQGG